MRPTVLWARRAGALALTAAVAAAPAPASARDEAAPANALGVADAVRGTATGLSALVFNPAGMSLIRQYALDVGWTYQDALDGHGLNASAVDSSTNPALALGVSYTYVSSELGVLDRDGSRIRGALSTGFRGQDFGLYVGLGGQYTDLTIGASDGDVGPQDDVEFFTLDGGLLLQLGSMFSLGVTGHNLIDTKAVAEAPRSIGFGAAALFDALTLSFDAVLDLQSLEDETATHWAFGAQYLIEGLVVVRAGFGIDGLTDTNRFSVGAGYVSKALAVDVGFSRTLSDEATNTFAVNARLFLP